MFGITVLIAVVAGAALLALDTKRRTGRIVYWRVIVAVAIPLFGAGSQIGQEHLRSGAPYDPWGFLAGYAGMLAFLWFLFLRPREVVETLFRDAVSRLKKGENQQALVVFNQAIEKAKSSRDKGRILCNMAICSIRLGQRDAAIKTLTEAVGVLPSVRSQIEKDSDFSELHNDEQFRALVAKT
jgi:tetratricopeptide (TPR) repeat protein